MELTERKKKVLRAIVESYIATAEPVGSKAVAEQMTEKVSSATIRNEMADLEEMGYLEKPHTSAGRVPSPKGYRLYVNELMDRQRVSLEETQQINEALKSKMAALDKVIGQAGKLVSQMTNYPAFAMAAAAKRTSVARFDLLLVDRNSFIAVVMTDAKVVRNKLIRLPIGLTKASLEPLTALLNATFTGKTLEELTPELVRGAESTAGGLGSVISLTVSFAVEVLEDIEDKAVYTTGASHILEQPEYQDVNKAQKLLSYMNDAQGLSELPIPAGQGSGTKILIGPENIAEELKDTSVILASYDIGEGMRGVVGVVGPTRMDYAKVAAKLSCVADNISQIFGKTPDAPKSLGEKPETKKLPAAKKDGANGKE